jgi:hypothetical protein
MPTTRTRRRRTHRELTDDENDWLRGGAGGSDQKYFWTHDDFAALWREFADDIVDKHVAASPGTRPHRWWGFSAPERRRRLGGIGTPRHQDTPVFLCHELGVPLDWIWDDSEEWYRLNGTLLDLADPPIYESQAAYLERLELLLPGERKRLKPKDFKPQSVIDILGIELEDDDSA